MKHDENYATHYSRVSRLNLPRKQNELSCFHKLFLKTYVINHFVIEKKMSDDSCVSIDIATALIVVAAGQRMQLKPRIKRRWWSPRVYRNREE